MSDSKNLISVIMPVRAVSAFTADAINSILRQTHTHFELLLIGQDMIHEDVKRLPADNRIKPIARTAPGVVNASNTGLELCKGDYIARMDDDDLAHPERLEQQLALAIKHRDKALLSTRVAFFNEASGVGRGFQDYAAWLNTLTKPEPIYNAMMIESPMPNPGLFAHRQVWKQLEGYRDKPWPEDYDLILRAWLQGVLMCKPCDVLLQWRDHASRLTRTDKRYSKQAFIQLKAWALLEAQKLQRISLAEGVWICGTGRNARYWHDALANLNITVHGFVDLHSDKRRYQKRHLPVITYEELAQKWQNVEQQNSKQQGFAKQHVAQHKVDQAMIISAITNPLAREKLRQWFHMHKREHWRHYIIGG